MLMDIDEPEWFIRLILASPLNIERPRPLLHRRHVMHFLAGRDLIWT
jgi:hypothetical protein